MVKVLIVDDERIDREGVRYLLEKHRFPVETVLAENAEEALQLLEQQRMDVLLTDICMPGLSGLDLIGQVRQLYPHMRCVIYSAYGEFEYARKAMQCDVRHYLLKPIKQEEFCQVMSDVLEDLQADRTERFREEVLQSVLVGSQKPMVFPQEYEVFYIDLSKPVFADAAFDPEGTVKGCLGHAIVVSLNEFQALCFVTPGGDLDNRLTHLCQQLTTETGAKVTIARGGPVRDTAGLLQAYSGMEAQMDGRFFSNESQVIGSPETTEDDPVDCIERVREIEQLIRRREKPRALSMISQLLDDLQQQGSFSSIYLKYICSNLVHCCTESNPNIPVEKVTEYIDSLFHCSTIYELRPKLLAIMDAEVLTREDDESSVIQQVLEMIEQEYRQDISLEQIADRVFLSPSYLSYYFKKETGKNFIKYLTVFRLEKAKELLTTTNIKVITISEMVGYLNSSYFCLLFKNYTGMTPVRYREEAAKDPDFLKKEGITPLEELPDDLEEPTDAALQ